MSGHHHAGHTKVADAGPSGDDEWQVSQTSLPASLQTCLSPFA